MKKDGFWKLLKDIYAEYKVHCEENHYTVRSSRDLSQMLQSKGLERKRLGNGINFRIVRKEIESDIS